MSKERDHALRSAVSLGLIGGAVLALTVRVTTRGPAIFVPYAAIVVLSAAYLRRTNIPSFGRRFGLTLVAFMTATAILYLFIATVTTHSLFRISAAGHAWRLGMMLGIGVVVSTLVAAASGIRHPRLRTS
jgi:hypothetical protein